MNALKSRFAVRISTMLFSAAIALVPTSQLLLQPVEAQQCSRTVQRSYSGSIQPIGADQTCSSSPRRINGGVVEQAAFQTNQAAPTINGSIQQNSAIARGTPSTANAAQPPGPIQGQADFFAGNPDLKAAIEAGGLGYPAELRSRFSDDHVRFFCTSLLHECLGMGDCFNEATDPVMRPRWIAWETRLNLFLTFYTNLFIGNRFTKDENKNDPLVACYNMDITGNGQIVNFGVGYDTPGSPFEKASEAFSASHSLPGTSTPPPVISPDIPSALTPLAERLILSTSGNPIWRLPTGTSHQLIHLVVAVHSCQSPFVALHNSLLVVSPTL